MRFSDVVVDGAYNRDRPLVSQAAFVRILGQAYQLPVFTIDTQGSVGSSGSPCWSSSMDMPSGERTNAIRPSRGGRKIVVPDARKR